MRPLLIKNQRGFTLVEIAVISPILILVTVGLIAGLILIANNVSGPNRQNSLIRSTQRALDMIEKDVINSSTFLTSVPTTDYTDSYSVDYSTLSFSNRLVIQKYDVAANPNENSATVPAFGGVSPCVGGTIADENNTTPILIIYFVKNNSLYRRTLTITTGGPTCGTKLAQQSCSESQACTVKDIQVTTVGSVDNFTVEYFLNSSTTTPITNSADVPFTSSVSVSINSTITSPKQNDGNYTSTLRIGRLNN